MCAAGAQNAGNSAKTPPTSDPAASANKGVTPFSKKFVCDLEDFIARINGPQSQSFYFIHISIINIKNNKYVE